MTEQMRLFDDTELLPLFAQCPATVEVEPFENPTEAALDEMDSEPIRWPDDEEVESA